MKKESEENRIIVITGPTAVGKTKAAVELAKYLETEIISADSMQVYRGMDIGTAKVTKEEAGGIVHHLIDICDPSDNYDVTVFQNAAKKIVDEIHRKGKIPVICGGTGFYIQALLYDIDFTEEGSDPVLREELNSIAKTKGNQALHDLLFEMDRETAQKIPENDVKRVVRAIEFYKAHGTSITVHNQVEERKKEEKRDDFRLFVLYDKKEALDRRINERVDRMMEEGLLEEAKKIFDLKLPVGSTALQAIGYRELFPYFEGACSLTEAVEKIKTDTRRYAKRQITWFKKENNTIWIDIHKGEPINEIKRYIW